MRLSNRFVLIALCAMLAVPSCRELFGPDAQSEKKGPNPLELRLEHAAKVAAFEPEGPDEVVSVAEKRVVHPTYAGLSLRTKWFLGEHSFLKDTDISVPGREDLISGTDLGSSVHLNGRDFFYLGDTFWPGRTECGRGRFDAKSMQPAGCAPNACCNDAIVVSEDSDPTDGLDVGIPLVRSRTDRLNFKPLIIPGIHDNPNFLGEFWHRNRDPNYTAPGGSALVHNLVNDPGARVVLWYSTAVWPQGRISEQRSRFRAPRSYVAVSKNGYDFESLVKDKSGEPAAFSLDKPGAPTKFLCTAPVEVTAEQLQRMCDDGTDGSADKLLCRLPEKHRARGGLLVFGSGRNYRLSPLYLVYLSHAHLARGDGFYPRFAVSSEDGSWGWTEYEGEATAVIGEAYTHAPLFRTACMGENGFWKCAAAVRELARTEEVDEPTGLFGEVSVKLILEGPAGMTPTLVMLSNHQGSAEDIPDRDETGDWKALKSHFRNTPIFVRTASLDTPHLWSAPEPTGVSGYGPYIIDRFTDWDEEAGELSLWHVVSMWRGPPMSDFQRISQYGVATTEVRIPWPAGGAK